MYSDKYLLDKIVSALTEGTNADIESNTSKENLNENFCIEEILAPADIEVTVKEVGKLSFPLSQECLQKLTNISTTAKFSLGEKIVLEKNIRDTQMIESKSLNVTINQEALSHITSNMKKLLGLPANSTLSPHLYNMLIYGPRQFFNQHRDSEKLPNVLATLVIILPSPRIGGDLIIVHGEKKHIFVSENVDEVNAKCICFSSDCLHDVDKVIWGYCVALTFNVVLEAGELPDTACTNEELKIAVRDYFNTGVAKVEPKKLVFFLNHTYSERTLLWNLLKGEDCDYDFSFRSVARELHLEVHLALANIHQSWTSTSDYKPVLDDLLKTETTLNYWVDVNNLKLPYGEYCIGESEFCFSRETDNKNFDPTKEEFSGPTDNAGATIDYWYKRATIVLWRKSDSLMVKFKLNFDGAMTELRTLISVPGNEKKVAEIMDKAANLSQRDYPTTDYFVTFVNIALYVKAKREAQGILSPFCLGVLIPKNVQMLTRLQQQYGIDWLIELFDALRRGKGYDYFSDSAMVSETIDPFVHEFLNSEGDRWAMEYLLKAEVAAFISSKRNTSPDRPRELFKACGAIGQTALQEELVQYLTSQQKLFTINELVKLYHQLQNIIPPDIYEILRVRLEDGVKKELLSQTRDAGDLSLSEVLYCNCEDCNLLTRFLRSKTNFCTSWRAHEDVRRHVISTLKRSEAPVSVTIERKARPYAMVFVKSTLLYLDSLQKCTELKAMLQTLVPKNTEKKKESLEKNGDEKCRKL